MTDEAVLDAAPIRLGAVSFLNTLPLIEGLGKCRDAAVTLTAPARLIDLLLGDEIDIGLVSLIDAQRSPEPLVLLPVGMIGCDGPTMTVRLFSREPLERVRTVHADADSHTSVALLRVLMGERHGIAPSIVEFDVEAHHAAHAGDADRPGAWPEAMLVIGDKVVKDSPPAIHYPHQVDLGEAWRDLTGLPFVYAVWMIRESRLDWDRLPAALALLDRTRRHNATRLDWIADARAPLRAWPAETARRYLGELLRYEVSPAHRESVDRFFDLCARHAVIPTRRPTRWADA